MTRVALVTLWSALSACSLVGPDAAFTPTKLDVPVVDAVVVSSVPGGYGRALRVEAVGLAPAGCFEQDSYQFTQEGTRVLVDVSVRSTQAECLGQPPTAVPLRLELVARGEGPHTLVFDGVDGVPLEVPFRYEGG